MARKSTWMMRQTSGYPKTNSRKDKLLERMLQRLQKKQLQRRTHQMQQKRPMMLLTMTNLIQASTLTTERTSCRLSETLVKTHILTSSTET